MEAMPKKKTLVRNPWTKEDLRELKAHSKTRTPVVEVAKAMKWTEAAVRQRRRQSGSVLVIAVEDALLDRLSLRQPVVKRRLLSCTHQCEQAHLRVCRPRLDNRLETLDVTSSFEPQRSFAVLTRDRRPNLPNV
jgi:hypothetical protein